MREIIAKLLKFPIDIILWFKGIRIRVVKDQERLNEIGRLRKKVFVKEELIDAGKIPDIWLDDYDKCAINIAAFKTPPMLTFLPGKIIGGLRLIDPETCGSLPVPELPIERIFCLKKECIPCSCHEVAKLIVDHEYRGRKRYVLFGLIKKAFFISWQDCAKRSWVAIMDERLNKSLKIFGARSKELENEGIRKNELYELMRRYFEGEKRLIGKPGEPLVKKDIRPYAIDLETILLNNVPTFFHNWKRV